MQRIRWGIISTGRIAHQFASDFKFVKNGELVAVASRTIETAKKFSDQYSIPKAYASYQELFADDDIDAVYVASPHSLHLENSTDAINSGKAVLCEKPLTITADESTKLIKLAQEKNVYLMEAMWTYFLPAIKKAKQWVDEGKIGELKHIKVDFGYPQLPYDPDRREYNKELGGGCMLELGIYTVAMAWLFTGENPIEIKTMGRRAPNGVEDDVNILYNYKDKAAVLGASYRCKLQNWAYIIGQDGYIAIPDFWRAGECMRYELDTLVEHYKDGRESFGFNYENEAVNNDIIAGRLESEIMPHAYSQKFQEHIEDIKRTI